MPTNVKIENMPENVQNPLNPTKNTKLAEKPSKYKNTNVSTSKVVKFEKINLLKNRLDIVGNVKVVVVENSVVKSPFGKIQVGEARSSPVEKKEAGSHQVEIEARSQKRKRLEENFEDSPSKKKFGNGGVNVKIFEHKSDKSRAGGVMSKTFWRSLEIWLSRPYMKGEGIRK